VLHLTSISDTYLIETDSTYFINVNMPVSVNISTVRPRNMSLWYNSVLPSVP
jgi:hypothetical protein